MSFTHVVWFSKRLQKSPMGTEASKQCDAGADKVKKTEASKQCDAGAGMKLTWGQRRASSAMPGQE